MRKPHVQLQQDNTQLLTGQKIPLDVIILAQAHRILLHSPVQVVVQTVVHHTLLQPLVLMDGNTRPILVVVIHVVLLRHVVPGGMVVTTVLVRTNVHLDFHIHLDMEGVHKAQTGNTVAVHGTHNAGV